MYLNNKKGNILKKAFNPDSFFTTTTIEDIKIKLKHLESIDFNKISLNEELTKINYEITSPKYKDFIYKNLDDYFSFEIDTIV